MRRIALLTAAILGAACASADPETGVQQASTVATPDIPDTDIFLAPLSFADGEPTIGAFINATDHHGYDNQPSFLNGEAAFYYVAANEAGKTDIRLYDIARGASQPVFASADRSEYSPKEAPGGGLSYIQENPAGDVTRVHRRALAGDVDGEPVADFAPLGYYAWLDGGETLGVYYRSEPGSLYRVDLESGAPALIHEGIGRALAADKAGAHLWFTVIVGDDTPTFRLMRYDSDGGAVAELFDLPANAQDFALTIDDAGAATGIFSASGSMLYWRDFSNAESGPGWVEIAELPGVAAASRIAVSDNRQWIAVVGESD